MLKSRDKENTDVYCGDARSRKINVNSTSCGVMEAGN